MEEAGKPPGKNHDDVVEAAGNYGSVDFEGRQRCVVSFSDQSGMFEVPSARIDLDMGDEFLVLFGYFRGGESIEMGRQHPF